MVHEFLFIIYLVFISGFNLKKIKLCVEGMWEFLWLKNHYVPVLKPITVKYNLY